MGLLSFSSFTFHFGIHVQLVKYFFQICTADQIFFSNIFVIFVLLFIGFYCNCDVDYWNSLFHSCTLINFLFLKSLIINIKKIVFCDSFSPFMNLSSVRQPIVWKCRWSWYFVRIDECLHVHIFKGNCNIISWTNYAAR